MQLSLAVFLSSERTINQGAYLVSVAFIIRSRAFKFESVSHFRLCVVLAT